MTPVSVRIPSSGRFPIRALFPLTLASLGLHALLLLMPTPTAPPEAEAEPPPPEAATIEVQDLADLVGSDEPIQETPELETAPEPAQEDTPVPAAAPPEQLVLTEVPEEIPKELPPEEDTTTELPPPPDEEEEVEVPPAFDASGARSRASGRVRQFSQDLVDPSPVLLRANQREFFFQSSDLEAPPKAGITDMPVFNNTRPETILPEIQANFANDGLNLIEAGSYGGNPFYQLVDASGNEAGYLSVILGGGGQTTILAFWEINPLAQ
jgi:outer membrane biosynthesis protein TonB